MGVVYEAVAVDLNRTVALKLLRVELLARAESRDRFQVEAEAIARLAHPNVVHIYEVGVSDGRPFLAMEFVPGGSLADRLSAGPLPVAVAIDLVRALARAVQHAHDRGVLHRDLKPANVMLGDEPPATTGAGTAEPLTQRTVLLTPKLTDFGLAKFLDRGSGRTRTGMVLGTPAYMAPEVITSGPGAASPASDVYGLGAILYECLTGRPPADGANTWITLRQVVETDPEPPGRFRPNIARGLDAVCLKALAKDPAQRYPSARAMAEDLDRLAAGRSVLAHTPTHRLLRGLWKRVGRGARAVAAALVAAVLLFGALDYRARYRDAVEAERVGRELLSRGAFDEAEPVLTHGLTRIEHLPGTSALTGKLTRAREQSRRGRQAAELHHLVDRLRFGFDADSLAGSDLKAVAGACDALWRARGAFVPAPGARLDPIPERQLRTDLLDLALLSADFRVRDGSPEALRAALERLDEAGEFLGPDPALARIRAAYRGEPVTVHPDPNDPTISVWELYALGRSLLNADDTESAAPLLRRAVELDPRGFWPNFHLAICAYRRGRAEEAIAGFSACLSLTQQRRGLCYYNRARAYTALGRVGDARECALRDLNLALEHEPALAEAALNRGLLHAEAERFPEAVADLERARRNGYDPAVVHYHRAVVFLSATDVRARALLDQLRIGR
jgi:tetratricopeptide (TPR) repeat protein/tRNA A-37 threonylcarbamoyl transferase component Bud32